MFTSFYYCVYTKTIEYWRTNVYKYYISGCLHVVFQDCAWFIISSVYVRKIVTVIALMLYRMRSRHHRVAILKCYYGKEKLVCCVWGLSHVYAGSVGWTRYLLYVFKHDGMESVKWYSVNGWWQRCGRHGGDVNIIYGASLCVRIHNSRETVPHTVL